MTFARSRNEQYKAWLACPKPQWARRLLEHAEQESSGTEPTKHIGPMAQQWAELFGGNGLVIDYQDIAGVLLAAVKELAARVKQLEGGALCQE